MIRKLTSLILPALALAGPAYAANDAQAITEIEAKWTAAFLTHDAHFVSSVVADDWTGFDPDGKRQNRAAMIAHVGDRQNVTNSARNHDVVVRVFGDIAVAQGYETEKSSAKGKNTSGTYFWTDVFQRRGGHWLAVMSQTAKAP